MASAFHRFQTRFDSATLRGWFAPRKPRNALLRVALGLLGVAVLAGLLVVGLFVGIAMLAFGLAQRLLSGRGRAPASPGRVVDAEYTVVNKAGPSLLR